MTINLVHILPNCHNLVDYFAQDDLYENTQDHDGDRCLQHYIFH